MIETIITEYLKNNRRLILPELGAFLKKENGSIVFVPFLNRDDGVLNALVGQSYGTSQADSATIISQYAAAIRSSVSENGYYLIQSLGTLKKDGNGILYLDSDDFSPVRKPAPAAGETVGTPGCTPPSEVRKAPPMPEPVPPAAPVRETVPETPVTGTTPTFARPVPHPTAQREARTPVSENAAPPTAPYRVPAIDDRSEPNVCSNAPETSDRPAEGRSSRTMVNRSAHIPFETAGREPVGPRRPSAVGGPAQTTGSGASMPSRTAEPAERPAYFRQPGVRPAPTPEPVVSAERNESRRTAPRQSANTPRPKKKTDVILVIAIVVAVLAVAVMIYSYFADTLPVFNLK